MGLIDKWKKSREEKEKIKLVREEEMKKLELAREENEREDAKNKELNEIWDKVKDFKTGYGTREKDENMKELQSLCSMSRVSMFKEKLNNTEGDNPVEVINNIDNEDKIEVKVEEVVEEVKEEVIAENESEQKFVDGIEDK